jgi:hypothetical protein
VGFQADDRFVFHRVKNFNHWKVQSHEAFASRSRSSGRKSAP